MANANPISVSPEKASTAAKEAAKAINAADGGTTMKPLPSHEDEAVAGQAFKPIRGKRAYWAELPGDGDAKPLVAIVTH